MDVVIWLVYNRVYMITILARLPKDKEKTSRDTLAWYGRALVEGYGIVAPLPKDDQDFLDLLMGLFVIFLQKRFERGTFFAVIAEEDSSSEDLNHAKEMLDLFSSDTLLVEKERDSENYIWVDVENNEVKDEKKFGKIAKTVYKAKGLNKKVAISYYSSDESEESFVSGIEKVLSLRPNFIATDKPRKVRMILDKHKTESSLRVFLRSKPVLYIRGRIGYLRFLARELPIYSIIYILESITGKVITLHTRPLYSRDYTVRSDDLKDMPKCAIVIQGPVMHKSDFTLETIRMYRKMFPNVQVILSTWEGEDEETMEKIREEGAEVVISKSPGYGGPGNTNMQLASSSAGIKFAREMGFEYVLKQRTDVRMYNPRAIEFMLNLLKHFPPSERSGQRARLIATGSALYQPYQYGEFLFGAIEDMDVYYVCPLIKEGQEFENYVVEVYIPTEFLKKKGWNLEWTIDHGRQIMRECFIVLDWSMLDKITYKYFQFRYWEYQNQRSYTESIPSNDASRFDDWLNIYEAYENKVLRPGQRLLFKLLSRSEDLD